MIGPTPTIVCVMGIMLNARANSYLATRHMLLLQCKRLKKSYVDVLLGRLMTEGLIERELVPCDKRGKKLIWGYRATEEASSWWMNHTVLRSPPRPTLHEYSMVPLGEIIGKDGWVERWNDQIIRLDPSIGEQIEKYGRLGEPSKKDRAQQRVYDCPGFKVVFWKGKRSEYKIRLKFRLEPWREHLAEWLVICRIPDEAISSVITDIESQLPGCFKQQEHPVIGAYRGALKRLEGRFKIDTRLEGIGPDANVVTQVEYSRDVDFQVGGDGQLVDCITGGLIAYQHESVIQVARERAEKKVLLERIKRLEKKNGIDHESDGDVSYIF